MKSIKRQVYGYYLPPLTRNMKDWFGWKGWLDNKKSIWGGCKKFMPKRRHKRHMLLRDVGRLMRMNCVQYDSVVSRRFAYDCWRENVSERMRKLNEETQKKYQKQGLWKAISTDQT